MRPRAVVQWLLVTVLVVGLVIPAVIALISGAPVGLSYVTSGSMAPTIDAGDGFIAVPTVVTGPPAVGDVVIYDAETLNDGGFVTHRIVGEGDGGYLTAGDANPFTDQDAGEPPVRTQQVVAVALEAGGGVVTIGPLDVLGGVLPGALSLTGTSVLSGLFWAGIGLMLLGGSLGLLWDDRRSRSTDREGVISSGVIVVVLVGVIVGALTLTMAVGTGPTGFQAISATGPSGAAVAIPAGENATVEYTVQNRGVIPMTVMLESTAARTRVPTESVVVPPRDGRTLQLAVRAPERAGSFEVGFVQGQYLPILPAPLLGVLFGLSPWVPIVVIDAIAAIVVWGVLWGVVGRGPIRLRRPQRDTPVLVRLRRWLRR